MKTPSVFTIAPSAPFAETLARGVLGRAGGDPLALSAAVIYLPTRRAARNFGDAFARVMGGAALLPQFRPLGDSDEDDLLFDAASDALELPPAITPLRRQLLLAQLIRGWNAQLSFAQSAAMADSLAGVMDEVETQGADLSRLPELVPPELAEHWQGVTRFLDILREQWPKMLAAEGALNPAARRVLALQALAGRLESAPPQGLVIAAGSTGSIPATAELLKVIARLPRGAVVMPGLDTLLDSQSWDDLDPGHPQYGLKQLLSTIGCDRADVADWHDAPVNRARETLIRETLRPAPTTDAWRALAGSGSDMVLRGLAGMALAACADPAQEALTIALALRHALESPQQRAALVTPDRSLARRVAAELARWGVAIDDSAGRPLANTPAGAFLCLLAEAVESRFAPVSLLALLKHPFARRGEDPATFRARARELDRWCLRGPRPDPGLDGIATAIEAAAHVHHPPPPERLAALRDWWRAIAAILTPPAQLFAQGRAGLETLLAATIAAAEQLACDEVQDCILWRGTDGFEANRFCDAMLEAAAGLPEMECAGFAPLLRTLLLKPKVRSTFGQHPRLAILGTLEARLLQFDLTILGGLNEGSWPAGAGADPWFSRPMRKALWLEQPERGIGLSAHDFAMLAAGPRVLMTRAEKQDGAPTLAARWLQRMEQLVLGLDPAESGHKTPFATVLRPSPDYAALASRMDAVARVEPAPRPAPTPPVAVRPRGLSVTEIETWLRDPYAIYARHILKLRPLDGLEEEIGPLERGNALHKALEDFITLHPGDLPEDALAMLVRLADDAFAAANIPRAALAVWRPRFLGAAQSFIAVEQARRAGIAQSFTEIAGRRIFGAPGGDFILRGKADRIDVMKDGSAVILDYKTGAIPSPPQVQELLSPQLPLEAAMLAADGFGIGARIATGLLYLSLADGRKAAKPVTVEEPVALAARAAEKLAGLIARFDAEKTPYLSRVRPYRTDSVGDYDHLARVGEWSAAGGDET